MLILCLLKNGTLFNKGPFFQTPKPKVQNIKRPKIHKSLFTTKVFQRRQQTQWITVIYPHLPTHRERKAKRDWCHYEHCQYRHLTVILNHQMDKKLVVEGPLVHWYDKRFVNVVT